jgi:DNA (cytosine-5)-methyltransferase 1
VAEGSAGSARESLRPLAIDLFSGAGGLSLGFEQAGFDVVAAVEYDPVHAASHLFNFPRCEVLCRSVSGLSGEEVVAAAHRGFYRHHPAARWPGRIDAVIGGPPCQGFSYGGKRELDDQRNTLILEFVRLVEEIRPRSFCMENVAGILEPRFHDMMGVALARLRRAGYVLTGDGHAVNAENFGVPQRRQRVILLGALGDAPPDLAEQSDLVSVREAIAGLPPVSVYSALLDSDELVLSDAAKRLRNKVVYPYTRGLAGLAPINGDLSCPRQWDSDRLTNSKRTIHSLQTKVRFEATKPGHVEPRSRLYRLPLDGPARTLRAGTGSERGSHTAPRPIHPTQNRVITVREAARLHGYPDWFRFHVTNWHGHRQVGNSVPPPLARAAGRALQKVLGVRPSALRASIELGEPSLLRLSGAEARVRFDVLRAELPAPRQRKKAARNQLMIAE